MTECVNDGVKLDRRSLLAGLSAGVAADGIGAALAQQAPTAVSEKGPLVWLDMDQKQLDDAYDQSKYAPNLQQIIHRYTSNSNAMRSRLGEPKRFNYGPTPIERLEVYATRRPNAPIHIHIHGGAWHQRPAADYAFPAEMLMNAGAHYVVPDFISVDEANGDLMPMVQQVRSAIAWTLRNAPSFGGDAERVYLSGFSSGGPPCQCCAADGLAQGIRPARQRHKRGGDFKRHLRSQAGPAFRALEICKIHR
jgi:arylformamidase